MSFRFSGAGPGVHTRDGCSVELYRKLPYLDDLEEHRSLFAPGTEVLELGCGTGRMTRRLLEWRARVTAVDNSAEMLAELPKDALSVCGDIETLNLERRFDVALLASNLINHPAAETRSALIDAVRRHLRRHGRLLLECYDATWLREVQPGATGRAGDISIYVERVTRDADALEMTLRYEVGGERWWHSSVVVALSEADIEALLKQAGFGSFAWSGGSRWLRASRI